VIEGEQGDKKKKVRNDRIVAVEKDAHSWEDIKTMDDLGKQFCRELEEFFVNYHKLSRASLLLAFPAIYRASATPIEKHVARRLEEN
jgi:inorganic pyrophosphatase